MEQSALFLAANSFKKPFEHLSQDETKKMVQVYLTYLSDHTELIANPGIRVRLLKDIWPVISFTSTEKAHTLRPDITCVDDKNSI